MLIQVFDNEYEDILMSLTYVLTIFFGTMFNIHIMMVARKTPTAGCVLIF